MGVTGLGSGGSITLSLGGSAGLGASAALGTGVGAGTGVGEVLVTSAGLPSVFVKVLFFGTVESKRRTSKESSPASIVIRSGNIFANLYSPTRSPMVRVIISLSPFRRGLPGLTIVAD